MAEFTLKIETLFATREEYLKWRTQWKAAYAALSEAIRDIKFARWFADSRRGGVKMSEAQVQRYEAVAARHKGQWGFLPNHKLAELKGVASAMLAERKASKILAQEQYLKLHPAARAAA